MRSFALGCLLLVGIPATVAAAPAYAADDVVLARLRRIARGEWRAPRPIPYSTPYSVPYARQIRTAARRHGLSASLLAALVRAESAFKPRAVSSAGARGLGQLMPATARALGVVDPFDPAQNLDGSARYLAEQVERFGSVRLALAAYHAGPQRARRGLHRVPAETRVYVARVLRFEREYRNRGLP